MNKVLFLTHWFPTKNEPYSGVFIKKHAESISYSNEIYLVHFDISYSKKILGIKLLKETNTPYQSYRIEIKNVFYKFFYYFIPFQYYLLNRLLRKYKINDFNCVHSNVIFPSGLVASKIKKKFAVNHVHTEHWSKFENFMNSNLLKNKGKSMLKNVDCVSTVSANLKNTVSKYYDINKIYIIPNVIDSSDFYYEVKNKKEEINFISIANWQKPKNPFHFLDALNEISKLEIYNFKLKIVGDGYLLDIIKSRNYNFEIHFVGKKSNQEICRYLQDSDFLLHGSDFETFSVILIESLLTGTPVIVSNVGIAKDVIDDSNGVICENNSLSWFNVLSKINDISYNHEKISIKHKETFSYLTISRLFNDLYKSLNNNNFN